MEAEGRRRLAADLYGQRLGGDRRRRDAPLDPAGPLKVTVPVADAPPTTDVGLIAMLDRLTAAGLTVKFAVNVSPRVAEMITAVAAETAVVVTVKVSVVDPAGTVTVAGATAAALLDESVTTSPPVGAGLEIVIVPVVGLPAVTTVGDRETPTSEGEETAPPRANKHSSCTKLSFK